MAGAVAVAFGSKTTFATLFYAAPAVNNDQAWMSTAGSYALTDSNAALYQAGDVVQFYGTGTGTNAFRSGGSSPINLYVVSDVGTTIELATTPGATGTAISKAVNSTTASATYQFQDWLTPANWSTSIPDSNTASADFSSGMASSVPGVAVGGGGVSNGNVTIDGFNYTNSSNFLTLISGGNGTGLNSLIFMTNSSAVPVVTQSGTSAIRWLNFGLNNFPLVLGGNQGLDINNQAFATSGATNGTGLAAHSNDNAHSIWFTNVTYPSLFGGITAQEGELGLNGANALGTGATTQNLTVGNTTTSTALLLAGVSLTTAETVGALNGNAWGRIWTSSGTSSIQTLTVGGNNASGGNFGGIIGTDFTSTVGTAGSINLATTGTGTETISGIIVGNGSVTVNSSTGGGLIFTGTNTYSGATTITAGALQANDTIGLPTTSFLSLDGGVLQSNGAASFTRSLNTSGDAFQFTANGGGFSAHGGQLTVTVGNNSATQIAFGAIVGTNIVGTLQFGSPNANAQTLFTNPIDLASGGGSVTRTVNVTAGAGGDYATLSGVISDSGPSPFATFAKTGNGTLVLSNPGNSYSGGTTITGGTLLVSNTSGSGTGSGTVSVGGSGALGGTGTIAGNTAVSGTIMGGSASAVGKLTLAGTGAALDLSSGGTDNWKLTNLVDSTNGTAGSDFDQIVMNGTGNTVTLGGSSNLTLTFIGNAAGTNNPGGSNSFWSASHSWVIIADGVTNTNTTTFANITDNAFADGNFSTALDGNGDVVLDFTPATAPMPEPANLGLLGLGGVAMLRRRRKLATSK